MVTPITQPKVSSEAVQGVFTLGGVLLALLPSWGQQDAPKSPPAAQPAPAQDEASYKGKPTSYWIQRLRHQEVAARKEAAQALSALGPEAGAAVPALLHALEDEDTGVRQAALECL